MVTPINVSTTTVPADAEEPNTPASITHDLRSLLIGTDSPNMTTVQEGFSHENLNHDGTPRDTSDPSVISHFDDLNNEKGRNLISAIDQLRKLGVDKDISLPQLVVVGEQSSGKSSLLEGLTGLAFPIATGLCTRFATRFIMQHDPGARRRVRVSVLPGSESWRDPRAHEKLIAFQQDLNEDDLSNKDKLEAMFENVTQLMGLSQNPMGSPTSVVRHFSDDVLEITFSGPDHNFLSVVDLPGLFQSTSRTQTIDDRKLIRDTVQNYIQDKNTIILAVTSATTEAVNQGVFAMTRTVDEDGERTIGVMTKCDIVQKGEDSRAMKLLRNEEIDLRHGWFAVRNRSPTEIQQSTTVQTRHERELEFFTMDPWNKIPEARRGVRALQKYLQEVLYEKIETQKPRIIEKAKRLYEEASQELEAMGEARETAVDYRRYLSRFARDYERLLDNSLNGSNLREWAQDSPLMLEPLIRKLKKDFCDSMCSHGHNWAFMGPDDTVDQSYVRSDGLASFDQSQPFLPTFAGSAIYQWIFSSCNNFPGMGFKGMLSPNLVRSLFHQQSKAWAKISEDFLAQVGFVIRKYTIAAHRQLVPEKHIRTRLLSKQLAYIESFLRQASIELRRVLANERDADLATINSIFSTTRAKMRTARFMHYLKINDLAGDGNPETVVEIKYSRLWFLLNPILGSDEQDILNIHDILKSYYEVARGRYVDNVIAAVANSYLTGEGDRINLFSIDCLAGMSSEELKELASEHPETVQKREDLKRKCQRLEHGMQILE
ncbi:hypothetical protein FH972_025976 [Carpinus fangiana]|uniref:GED domain-containing protein n=1 Tax=Carpinus fangiana TaxID=176857 RepID=A0A5N6L2N5_9ROSI|nr:hypothetical protein FH972_025976 [Carpinus fangiana]